MENPIELSGKEFKALSAQNRVEILKRLKERNYNLTELSNRLSISIPSVQKHLDILVLAGLIERVMDNRKWAYYTLTKKGKAAVSPEQQRFSLLLATALIVGVVIVGIAMFNSTIIPVLLESPQITLISYNAQTKSIELSWTRSAQPGVLYEIQRKAQDADAFETIKMNIAANQYSDRDVIENESYEYRVIAYQDGKKASGESQTVTTQKTTAEPTGTPSPPGYEPPIVPPITSPFGSTAPDSNSPGPPANDSNSQVNIELLAFLLNPQAGTFDQTVWFEGQSTTMTIQKDGGPAVLLTWNAISFTDVQFEIQKLNENGQWELLSGEITEPFWVDAQIQTGQTNTYRIQLIQNGVALHSNSASVFIS